MLTGKLFILYLLIGADVSIAISSNPSLDAEMQQFVEQYNSTAASSYYADSTHICAAGSYGYAQVINEEPVYDLYGRSSMGSNTKSMSSALIAVLLENNLVRGQTNGWETTLGSVFPDLAVGTPYEDVTLKALASMYAGFPANTDFWSYWYAENGTNMIQQRENLSRDAFLAIPESIPGTEFLYSNWGYVILGHVAEVSLNVTWEDALLTYLVLPLGMVPHTDGNADYFPFGAPDESGANWGHIFMNETTPHYPCDPNSPPYVEGNPDFQCDNCPNMGPAGTYSGGILNMSTYYLWTIQCASGIDTQSTVALSQQGCLEIQQLYASDGFYGFGWGVSMVGDGSGGFTKMLSHAGSNTFWIVYVNVFPELGYIAWAGSNSGRAEEDDMVHDIVAALPFYSFIDCSSSPDPIPSGDDDDDDELSAGAIVGIVFGCLVGIAVIAVLGMYVHRSFGNSYGGDLYKDNDLQERLDP
mmetsp:Transcript_9430/g.17652  ORF Transcript_9430/g.17652 Transcript_9430/m.17652 type:complete len:471 (+) Transcript_9430:32-1444(+)